ncbi:MAG: carboxylating nicotinate-nucleotide diphosphorylase [Gemmatimonadota bacterium]|nr:carboxylating nicotinate-nucleotide diphosphorylase [Gemmatimonadota bacterium]
MSHYHPPLRPTPPQARPAIRRPLTPPNSVAQPDMPDGFPLTCDEVTAIVRAALEEDQAFNDVSTLATVASTRNVSSAIVARDDGVICGIPLAIEAFRQLDASLTLQIGAEDSARVSRDTEVLTLYGHARGMLSAERVALNYMQRLSGIATLTARYVDLVRGTNVKVLDTRKTTPGWRRLEKYAVRSGGGVNHRLDLQAGVLIKDNHLAALGGDIAAAVSRARALVPPGTPVQVECDGLQQVRESIDAGADLILLDNMNVQQLTEAVALCRGKALTEASGGVTLETVRRIAETGVDRISVGALTHSAPALDLALDFAAL